MRYQKDNIWFSVPGILLFLFILIPLLATVLTTKTDVVNQTIIDPEFQRSFLTTCTAGVIATFLGLLIAPAAAFWTSRSSSFLIDVFHSIINIPVIIPHTAAGVALLLVFGHQSAIGRIFDIIGVRVIDSLAGSIIAMTFVSIPFLYAACHQAFRLLEQELEANAKLDGAKAYDVFLCIVIPQSWRAILSGAIQMWARGISEFGAVVILAYHPKTIPTLVYEWLNGYGLQSAQSITSILILITGMASGVVIYFSRRREKLSNSNDFTKQYKSVD
jgi:molybdate/tungstate transport system permease protein